MLEREGKIMTITESDAKKLHYELWDWLSHNPSKSKHDWPKFYKDGEATNLYYEVAICPFCFACYIGLERDNINFEGICCNCPLEKEACFNWGSFYYKWTVTKHKTRSKYARLIRDSWTREVTL